MIGNGHAPFSYGEPDALPAQRSRRTSAYNGEGAGLRATQRLYQSEGICNDNGADGARLSAASD